MTICDRVRHQNEDAVKSGIVAWQYRKIGEIDWKDCGTSTYVLLKANAEYECRRLTVYQE